MYERHIRGPIANKMEDSRLVFVGLVLLYILPIGKGDVSVNIHGGIKASKGMFPSVGYIVESDGVSRCGATLVNNGWAVTAAHCFSISTPGEPIPSRVVFGEVNTDIVSSSYHETKFDLIEHPDFKDETHENDIALLQLHDRVKLTNYVEPVDLSTTLREEETYNNFLVTGWGLTEFEESSSELRYGQVNLLSSADCAPSWPDYNENLMLCAGSSQVTACDGDDGGPLLSVDGNQTLVGIISFGIHNHCDANVGLNSVYTRVSSYANWIEDTIKSTGNLVSFSYTFFIIMALRNIL